MNSGTILTSPSEETRPGAPAGATASWKLALVCDFLEERWPSMDLFGDMLFQTFTSGHASLIQVEQLRPTLRPRLSRWPLGGASGALWNADRLLNRFHDYPAWLRRRAARFDLFHLVDHSYSQLILELPGDRTVVTCHDLDTFQCILEPEADPRPRWFRAMAQRSLKGFLRAAHVISVSAFTRDNLLRHGLLPADRITVIPPGADPVFFAEQSAGEDTSVRGFLPQEPFLLHVGSTIPRKRIDVLLRVFAGALRAFPDLRLVRVGGAFTAGQQALADELGAAGRIVQAPHLTKPQVAAVYRQAALVLQPSSAEGFGLPVIEALACGCPVLASDIPPLREAGGAAAEYRTPDDVEAWIETVVQLLRERNTSPETWELRRERGSRHAADYTWGENARRTIEVYRQVRQSHDAPLPERTALS